MDKLQTMVDKLSDLVVKHREISSSDAARLLRIKDSQVEEWARALEKQGFISVDYSAMRGMVLKQRSLTPSEITERHEKLSKFGMRIESSASKLGEQMQEQESKIPEIEKDFTELEADISMKLKQASRALGMLKDLQGIESVYGKEISAIEAEEKKAALTARTLEAKKKEAESLLSDSRKSLSSMKSRLSYARKQISRMRSQLRFVGHEKKKLDKELEKFRHATKLFEKHARSSHSQKAAKQAARLDAKFTKLQSRKEAFSSIIADLESKLASVRRKHARKRK
ncbi:hypothetical protein HYS54_01695 [Candidatus Micrarchaeota archaeon]|nr:hypothetical protein [Candidatus Micrarchaeota archaeon]